MHPCVIVIRKDIQEMVIRRYWEQKNQISNDIKYALWHGFINENLYNSLNAELNEKLKLLMDESFV